MVLFANRVRAKREPEKSTSISSAEEKRRMRSKMSEACSRVNIVSAYRSKPLTTEDTGFHGGMRPSWRLALIGRAYLDIAKPCRACAVAGSHHLLRLAFAAVWSSPECPLVARADGVHRVPKLGR